MPKKQVSFEEGMTELETLVRQIEGGELSLDDTLKAYERGMALTAQLQQKLQTGKGRLQQLTKDGQTVPMEMPDETL